MITSLLPLLFSLSYIFIHLWLWFHILYSHSRYGSNWIQRPAAPKMLCKMMPKTYVWPFNQRFKDVCTNLHLIITYYWSLALLYSVLWSCLTSLTAPVLEVSSCSKRVFPFLLEFGFYSALWWHLEAMGNNPLEESYLMFPHTTHVLMSTVEIVPVNSGCFCYSLGESKVKTAVILYEVSVYVMSLGQLFNAILCVKANR